MCWLGILVLHEFQLLKDPLGQLINMKMGVLRMFALYIFWRAVLMQDFILAAKVPQSGSDDVNRYIHESVHSRF